MPSRNTEGKSDAADANSLLIKKKLAEIAVEKHIKPNMRIALGSGSTAEEFIKALAANQHKKPKFCIASSIKSQILAQKLALKVIDGFDKSTHSQNNYSEIDIAIDGADEIDKHLRLIKGGGGCLLREKILAQSSKKMIILAEKEKMKPQLGAFPLPIEIDTFAWKLTQKKIENLFSKILKVKGNAKIRKNGNTLKKTDGGNIILDCAWGRWNEETPEILANELNKIPGVVEHGIFINEASLCLLAEYKNGKVEVEEKNKQSQKTITMPHRKG